MKLFLFTCLLLCIVVPSFGKMDLLKGKKHLKYIVPLLIAKAMKKPTLIPFPLPFPLPIDVKKLSYLKSQITPSFHPPHHGAIDHGWKSYHKSDVIVSDIGWKPKKEIIIIEKAKKEIPIVWEEEKWNDEGWEDNKWEDVKWKPNIDKWKGWKVI